MSSRAIEAGGSIEQGVGTRLQRRKSASALFARLCWACTWLAVVVLLVLLWHAGREGLPWLDWQFITSFPSRRPASAGIRSALAGTFWMTGITALLAIPVGVAAAIYLEEYSRKDRLSRFIAINIANLAGVPSIVYGLLGLTLFVRTLKLGHSVLAGSMTMTILILPVIIIAAREAIRAVPSSIRHAAYALGATRWQTVSQHVLPAAIPGITTGVILAMSRAIGETAPLIMIGALTYIAFVPTTPLDEFTVLPIQVFNWVSRPKEDFHDLAAAGIVVLLTVLLLMNSVAITIRHRFEGKIKW